MANKRARSLKQTVINGGSFRDRAIAEYHELLAADETFAPATFEKLRSAMRKKRLLYGERPIGVALRPHLLHHRQFQKLSQAAQRVTSALEKIEPCSRLRSQSLSGELHPIPPINRFSRLAKLALEVGQVIEVVRGGLLFARG